MHQIAFVRIFRISFVVWTLISHVSRDYYRAFAHFLHKKGCCKQINQRHQPLATCNTPSLITVYNYILVCGSSGVWHVSRQEWNCQKNCTLLLIIFGNMRHEYVVVSSCANAYCNRPLINVFVAERVTKIKIQELTSGAHAQ